ncbi:NlpC/P60 family protein [Leptospira sp. 96542]|nr:NlpC/P60 family protein [Leptospira sp. 96542]
MNLFRLFIFFFVFFGSICPSYIHSQNLSSLEEIGYNKQDQLLVRNEIRKKLGNKANSKEVLNIIANLKPWAKMEGVSAKEFVLLIERFSILQDYGIVFLRVEDLIPYFLETKPNERDIPYIGKLYLELVGSNVSEELVLGLFALSAKKKWTGKSLFLAGRMILVWRKSDVNQNEILKSIEMRIPANINLLSLEKQKNIFDKFLLDIKTESTAEQIETIKVDTFRFLNSKPSKENFTISSRRTEISINELGEWEKRERPKLDPSILFEEQVSQLPDGLSVSFESNLIQVSQSWVGTPYRYGGYSKSGIDCSGLTKNILIDSRIGVPEKIIPRSARDQASIGKLVNRSNLKIGNLVFFSASPNQSKITHVGLVLKNFQFIHASTSRGVVIQSLDEKWWKDRFVTARDLKLGTK